MRGRHVNSGRGVRIGIGLILLALLAAPGAGAAIRCGGNLVSEGDHAYELIAVCGEPDHKEIIAGAYLPGLGVLAAEERWYYNRGPRQLLRVARIRDGRVQAVETPNYGFDPAVRGECEPAALRIGMSGFELLTRCGEPAYRDTRYQLYPAPPAVHSLSQVMPIEEWVYDLGPGRFLRIVTLTEGIVREIDQGRRR